MQVDAVKGLKQLYKAAFMLWFIVANVSVELNLTRIVHVYRLKTFLDNN